MKKLILVFLMVFGMASVVNAKCIESDGKINKEQYSAKDFMAFDDIKAAYEKVKKEVEEILQIRGLTMEQAIAENYEYVKFLNGLEMLQKSDRCLDILEEYADKNNDEYYFYGATTPRELEFKGFINLLGKTSTNEIDLSGELGELEDEKLKAKANSDSLNRDVWLGK